jgi:PAS domain S-box-containing protein
VTELTDAVQVEQVKRSEALLAEAERVANVGSWQMDLLSGEGKRSMNLCLMLGLDQSQTTFAESELWELIHRDDHERVRAVIERAMLDRQPYQFQARFLQRDGSERALLTRGKVVVEEENRVVGRMGVAQDITERIRAERILTSIVTPAASGRAFASGEKILPRRRNIGFRQGILSRRRLGSGVRHHLHHRTREATQRQLGHRELSRIREKGPIAAGIGGWNQVDCVCFGHRRAAAALPDRGPFGIACIVRGLRALNPRMFDRAKPSAVGWTSLKRLQLSSVIAEASAGVLFLRCD